MADTNDTDRTAWLLKEFRACGTDRHHTTYIGEWRTDRSDAMRDLGTLDAECHPYTRTWLEGRVVSAPTELVVAQEDTVVSSAGLERFLASLEGRAA